MGRNPPQFHVNALREAIMSGDFEKRRILSSLTPLRISCLWDFSFQANNVPFEKGSLSVLPGPNWGDFLRKSKHNKNIRELSSKVCNLQEHGLLYNTARYLALRFCSLVSCASLFPWISVYTSVYEHNYFMQLLTFLSRKYLGEI